MAALWCECGERLSNTMTPNEIEYLVYSDKEWIDIVENEDAYTSPLLLPYPNHTAWLCRKCKKIHILGFDPMRRVALYELAEIKADLSLGGSLNMAVFWCECGERLSNSQNPDIEYRIYSDEEWIDIVENEEKYTSPLLIPFPKHNAWLCPKCKRIHIWETGSMERVALYERAEMKPDLSENDT